MKNHYLLDDERTSGANDDEDEIEVAITHFFDCYVVKLVVELRRERRCGLYVFYEDLLVQWAKLREGHGVVAAMKRRGEKVKSSEVELRR